jgi:hypothetical protein
MEGAIAGAAVGAIPVVVCMQPATLTSNASAVEIPDFMATRESDLTQWPAGRYKQGRTGHYSRSTCITTKK